MVWGQCRGPPAWKSISRGGPEARARAPSALAAPWGARVTITLKRAASWPRGRCSTTRPSAVASSRVPAGAPATATSVVSRIGSGAAGGRRRRSAHPLPALAPAGVSAGRSARRRPTGQQGRRLARAVGCPSALLARAPATSATSRASGRSCGIDPEGAHEPHLLRRLHRRGLLVDLGALDRVAEHDVVARDVEAIPAAPALGDGTVGDAARVERSARGRPPSPGTGAVVKWGDAAGRGMGAVGRVEGDAGGLDELAGPACAHAQEIGVEADGDVGAQTDGDALVDDLADGGVGAERRALEGKVGLDRAGGVLLDVVFGGRRALPEAAPRATACARR